jgi:cell division septation protein DedD
LVGLSLLAIPGFGLGLLAGVAWEDPGLLMSYVAGGTEQVGWALDSEQPPDVAAPAPASPPSTTATQATAQRSETRKPTERSGAERSSRKPEGRFSVQGGAFAEGRAAEDLAATLRGKGYQAHVTVGAGAGSARWRVRVGPLASREAADRAAKRLKSEERLPTWVIDESRPS